MKKYVVAFLFTPSKEFVWCIRKQKPEWQKDCLNGIGGKIEDGETAIEAMVREIKEESGATILPDNLINIGVMGGTNNDGSSFSVEIFTGTHDGTLRTMEEELIALYTPAEIRSEKHIGNVPMLIEACLYRLNGSSHFKKMTLEY